MKQEQWERTQRLIDDYYELKAIPPKDRTPIVNFIINDMEAYQLPQWVYDKTFRNQLLHWARTKDRRWYKWLKEAGYDE